MSRDAATARLLGETLRRAKPIVIADSLRRQIVYVTRLALSARRRGVETISPTIAELAKAAGCKMRQCRTNMRSMENWHAVVLLDAGGGLRAATYAFNGEALFFALMTKGCNPHPDLKIGLLSPDQMRPFSPRPRQSTPAVTPAVAKVLTPAVGGRFINQSQDVSPHENVADFLVASTPAVTPAVDDSFLYPKHRLNVNENGSANDLSLIYTTIARADFLSSFAQSLSSATGVDLSPSDVAAAEVVKDAGENEAQA